MKKVAAVLSNFKVCWKFKILYLQKIRHKWKTIFLCCQYKCCLKRQYKCYLKKKEVFCDWQNINSLYNHWFMISLILQGYGQCIETFITESQLGAYLRPDPFDDVLPLCTRSSEVIAEVFSNPDTVMAKLVQNIFHGKLQVDSGYSNHIPFHDFCSSSDNATPSNPPFHCILPEGTSNVIFII